jgi:hypothetical protein
MIFQSYGRDFTGISQIEKINKHNIELSFLKNQEFLLFSWENQLNIFDINNFDEILTEPFSILIKLSFGNQYSLIWSDYSKY